MVSSAVGSKWRISSERPSAVRAAAVKPAPVNCLKRRSASAKALASAVLNSWRVSPVGSITICTAIGVLRPECMTMGEIQPQNAQQEYRFPCVAARLWLREHAHAALNWPGIPGVCELARLCDRGAGGGRDASCLAPPAQIRTCGFPAYGSHLG